MKRLALLIGSFLLTCPSASAQPPDAKGVAFFENKIRPVLVEKCYQCHSAEAEKNKKLRGGLRLDTRDALLKGGDTGPVIAAGKKDGHLLKALLYDGDTKMPPKGKLPDAVIADFAQWLAMGAPDPRDGSTQTAKTIDIQAGKAYWAFQPLKNGPVPSVKNAAWGRTPLDRFILARLEEKGLQPAPQVNKERLLRRAYYDLLGVPPSPADVDAFLRDPAPDAYDKLVDRLLQGSQYGERWARHWLDVVRFAESGGYEFDGDRPGAYHYRDFVIKALNQDMPYDEFIRLQLAGDQLQKADYFASSATGFLVAGPYPGQVTSKTLQLIRYNHLDDMLSTLGSSMLGLSVGCARCHDHKYDPIPTADYYRLLACLGRTDSTNAKLDPNPEVYQKAKAAFDQEFAGLQAKQDAFLKDSLPAQLKRWQANPRPDDKGTYWRTLDISNAKAKGKIAFKELDDLSLLATGKGDAGEIYTLKATTEQPGIAALRLDAMTDATLPKNGPGLGAAGDFNLAALEVTAAPLSAPAKPVALKVVPDKSTTGPRIWQIVTDGKSTFPGGMALTVTLKFDAKGAALGRFRLSFVPAGQTASIDTPLAPQHGLELAHVLGKADFQPTSVADLRRAAQWYRRFDPATNEALLPLEAFNMKLPQPKLVDVFVAQSGRGGDVFQLIRGEVDKKNGVAPPGFLQVLTNAVDKEERWTGKATKQEPRIALASWITDTDQGAGLLLARVIVNRLWQHHLGRGIVATPNDFGLQGDPPSHPEMLDYLAAELIKNGWKLKPIHKLIMTSAVYMQSGELNVAGQKADPGNRLWWRRPARRLEAEAIRDGLLAVSATLDPAMHGPGTLDANVPRRSIYLKVKRSQMIPMLQLFDIPEAIQSIGERTTSTVPTQSLAFLNSPFVRQRAEKLAERVRPKSADGLPAAIEQAYLIALTRQPTSAERDQMLAFLRSQAESYAPNARAQDLALNDFCQVLLCLNEFIYVD